MGNDQCIHCWIPLALISTILIISLWKNISYCLKEKKQKGKTYEDYQKPCSEFYSEECPVYDNLNHCHQDMLTCGLRKRNTLPHDMRDESCYEQMSAHAQPHTSYNEAQTAEHQMCYASLDHSVKRKNKDLRKKKNPPPEMDEGHHTRISLVPLDSCIYLNSAQLNAENKLSEDATHDDSVSVFGFIPKTNDGRFW